MLNRVIFYSLTAIIGDLMGLGNVAAYVIYAAGNPVLLCVVGGHLLINLKQATGVGHSEGTSYDSSFTSMDFDLGLASEYNASGKRLG